MRILFDTNIVLDVLLDRVPFSAAATALFSHVERGDLIGVLGSTTVTTIYYLASKAIGDKETRKAVATLMELFEIAPTSRVVLSDALSLGFNDFEDAVLHESARHAGVQGIVTRDIQGFQKASLPIFSGPVLLEILREKIEPAKK